MIHKHLWNEHEKKAFGHWEKQRGQNNSVPFEGSTKICRCGKTIFIPEDKRLRTVEVERP